MQKAPASTPCLSVHPGLPAQPRHARAEPCANLGALAGGGHGSRVTGKESSIRPASRGASHYPGARDQGLASATPCGIAGLGDLIVVGEQAVLGSVVSPATIDALAAHPRPVPRTGKMTWPKRRAIPISPSRVPRGAGPASLPRSGGVPLRSGANSPETRASQGAATAPRLPQWPPGTSGARLARPGPPGGRGEAKSTASMPYFCRTPCQFQMEVRLTN